MKILIELPEDVYDDVKDTYNGNDVIYCAVKNGKPYDAWIRVKVDDMGRYDPYADRMR